jgi:hypothetical protein
MLPSGQEAFFVYWIHYAIFNDPGNWKNENEEKNWCIERTHQMLAEIDPYW